MDDYKSKITDSLKIISVGKNKNEFVSEYLNNT